MGVLLATGLLINFPIAGWTAAASLLTRVILIKVKGKEFQSTMYVLAGGFIAGSALVSFGRGTVRAFFQKS